MSETILTQGEGSEKMDAAPVTRPAHVPAKFWDAEAGVIRVDALLKSYSELERRLSDGQPDPKTPEGKSALQKLLGVPEGPDGYAPDLLNNVLESDPELNARLHALGFTPEQVQAVYDIAAEKLVPLIHDLAAEMTAEAEVEKLERRFGGREKWARVARQLLAFGRAALPPEILASLSSSAEGVIMLHDLMEQSTAAKGRAPGVPVGDHDLKTLQQMMRDPKYWRDHDPKWVAKVSEGFARLYG